MEVDGLSLSPPSAARSHTETDQSAKSLSLYPQLNTAPNECSALNLKVNSAAYQRTVSEEEE